MNKLYGHWGVERSIDGLQHAQQSLRFRQRRKSRGGNLKKDSGVRISDHLLFALNRCAVQSTYLWADLLALNPKSTRQRDVLLPVNFVAGAAGCLVGEYEGLIDAGHEN